MSAANQQQPSPDGGFVVAPNGEEIPTDDNSPLSARRINFGSEEQQERQQETPVVTTMTPIPIAGQPLSTRDANENQPYLECLDGAKVGYGLNEHHILQVENEDKGDGDSCDGINDFKELDDLAEDAIRDRLFLILEELSIQCLAEKKMA